MPRSLGPIASLGVLACALGSVGCTLIGASVGSTVPRYEPVPRSSLDRMPEGTRVRVELDDGTTSSGALEWGQDPVVLVDSQTKKRRAIESVRVKVVQKQVGTEWATGMFIGGAVDVAVVVVGLVIIGSAFQSPGSMTFGAATW